MKKFMTFVCAAFAVILMAACSGDSPKSVVEKSIKCLADKDYKGYVDLIYIDEDKNTPEEVEESKKQIAELLEAKLPMAISKTGEIKSYKAVSEEVSEDGKTATVKVSITYEKDGKETEKTEDFKVEKDKSGNWKIKM